MVVNGKTIREETGCGSIYVIINREDGKVKNVLIKAGKTGNCRMAQVEAIANVINVALEHGANLDEIARSLRYIRCEKPVFNGVLSCADAIARILEGE